MVVIMVIVLWMKMTSESNVLSFLLTDSVVFSWFWIILTFIDFGKRILIVFIIFLFQLQYISFRISIRVLFVNVLPIYLSTSLKVFELNLIVVCILNILLPNCDDLTFKISEIGIRELINKLTVLGITVVVWKVLYFEEVFFYLCGVLLSECLFHSCIFNSSWFGATQIIGLFLDRL